MSSSPPDAPSDLAAVAATDPVVDIITNAGLVADPVVQECAALAAGTHQRRFETRTAGQPGVNRSSFLWALWLVDDTVRSAFEQQSLRIQSFEKLLGITWEPMPTNDPYELGGDLDRALRNFVGAPRAMLRTVTPTLLATAVLEDVVENGGYLGDRLRRLGTDAATLLDALRRTMSGEPDREEPTATGPIVKVRDLDPRRFGVQLPPGVDVPGPYIARDVDADLDRLLRERPPVVAVVAPPMSGAVRVVYEALRRVAPDDRVLLLHELLADEDNTGRAAPEKASAMPLGLEELERLRSLGPELVWVRDPFSTLYTSPTLTESLLSRDDSTATTLVALVRPQDRDQAKSRGLLPDTVVELSETLSAEEQARARELYEGEVTTVQAVAAAVPRDHRVLRANYAADSAEAALLLDQESDHLHIRDDVDRLAKLIASTNVSPPLSIGLFGPWGSGKSFFMRQVQLRIADLAARSRQTPDDATGYLREIVPVEFNAWQYVHGSGLWAALINRVFEEIQEALGGDERYQQVLAEIDDKNIAVAQARRKVDSARAKVNRSRPAAEDRVIRDVAKDHDISSDSTEALGAALALDAATIQVSELRNEYDRLMSTTSRLDKGWATASTSRKALVLGLAAVGLALVVLCIVVPGALGQVIALSTGLASVMAAAVQILRPVNQGLEQAAKVLRADDADKQELQQAQAELEHAAKELAETKASGLAGLYGFVSDRSNTAEYRQYLGMAPMIRDDLQRLAHMSRRAEGIPGIDRIVIFIDDLDRCPAKEVVRVLEAVNLLFGFELFVVLVAVDSRWLLRSLAQTFSEAFDAEDGSAPTPDNYLEKIIQIPFWLHPMEPGGFERLVSNLAGDVDRPRGGAEVVVPQIQEGESRTPPAGRSAVDTETAAAEPDERGPDAPAATSEDSSDDDASGQRGGDEAGGAVGRRQDDLNPAALQLVSDEREFMTRFHPLVGTPRAAKRFVNTYQLLRVSVDDVGVFLRDEGYQPVLILVALVTGTLPVTDAMIGELSSMTDSDFEAFLAPRREQAQSDPAEPWMPVAAACDGLPTDTLTPEVIAEWLPRVARYSFHGVAV